MYGNEHGQPDYGGELHPLWPRMKVFTNWSDITLHLTTKSQMSAKNRPKFKELESALNELNLKTEGNYGC